MRSAAAGAPTPVLAGLLAWALLGEAPGLATLAGMGRGRRAGGDQRRV
ncbi:MAG: hypothetical protein U1E77_09445 [Inhella sp.]